MTPVQVRDARPEDAPAIVSRGRIGRRSYVPFGPFLILGALWAVLIR